MLPATAFIEHRIVFQCLLDTTQTSLGWWLHYWYGD